MSVRYSLVGSVRLRYCHEVAAIVEKIQGATRFEFDVYYADGPGNYGDEVTLVIDGLASFSVDAVSALDKLVESLGPYAVEPAVVEFEYDRDWRSILVVAATEEERASAKGRHYLEAVIVPELSNLTPADKARLIAILSGDSPEEIEDD